MNEFSSVVRLSIGTTNDCVLLFVPYICFVSCWGHLSQRCTIETCPSLDSSWHENFIPVDIEVNRGQLDELEQVIVVYIYGFQSISLAAGVDQ